MSLAERVTKRAVGVYQPGSIGALTRARRWQQFAATFPRVSEMRVLDVGGDARSWLMGGIRPAELTILNLGGVPAAPESWMTGVEGDACDPPPGLENFDLVFCNSVIEHVGGHRRRQQLAGFIRAIAPNHWVQTPYRYFPIEPHFLIPGLQHLPYRAQAQVIARWPVGNYADVTEPGVALEYAMAIELLSKTQFSNYFPDSEVISERLGPWVKSLIAVRNAAAPSANNAAEPREA